MRDPPARLVGVASQGRGSITAPAISGVDRTSEHPAPADGDVGMFALLRRWQEFLEVSGRAADSTRRQYLRAMIGFLAETLIDVRAVTEDDLVGWLAAKDGRGSTRGAALRALKSFYGWALARGLVATDPTAYLRVPRRKYGDAPALSPEELEAVLEAAESLDPRARWALQLAYATGARVGSLCAVLPSDVSLERAWISFTLAKGDKPYGVPLGPRGMQAAQHLLELIEYVPPRGKRRPTLLGVGTGTVWAWARRSGEIAGLKVWPHLLRHTTMTRLAEAGTDVRTLVEFANWSDASLVRRYTQVSDPNLRKAAEVL